MLAGSPFDGWQTRNAQLTRALLTCAHVRHNQKTCRKPLSVFRSPPPFSFLYPIPPPPPCLLPEQLEKAMAVPPSM